MIKKHFQNTPYFEPIALFLILKWALLEKKYHKGIGWIRSLRKSGALYGAYFKAEKSDIGPENLYFGDLKIE